MAKQPKYEISEEQAAEIKAARRKNKDKRVEQKLKALELRAEGKTTKEIAAATRFHFAYVSTLVSKYVHNGLESITGNHYGGNHKNITREEEAAILRPFLERAERGEMVDVKEIAEAYQAKVDHKVSDTQIYCVLHRHGWRKVMPRSKHPKSASPEAAEASKKLTQK